MRRIRADADDRLRGVRPAGEAALSVGSVIDRCPVCSERAHALWTLNPASVTTHDPQNVVKSNIVGPGGLRNCSRTSAPRSAEARAIAEHISRLARAWSESCALNGTGEIAR